MAKSYPDEVRQAAIEALRAGASVEDVAARVGAHPATVRRWRAEAEGAAADPEPGPAPADQTPAGSAPATPPAPPETPPQEPPPETLLAAAGLTSGSAPDAEPAEEEPAEKVMNADELITLYRVARKSLGLALAARYGVAWREEWSHPPLHVEVLLRASAPDIAPRISRYVRGWVPALAVAGLDLIILASAIKSAAKAAEKVPPKEPEPPRQAARPSDVSSAAPGAPVILDAPAAPAPDTEQA